MQAGLKGAAHGPHVWGLIKYHIDVRFDLVIQRAKTSDVYCLTCARLTRRSLPEQFEHPAGASMVASLGARRTQCRSTACNLFDDENTEI